MESKQHFNTHLDGLDAAFWRDFVERHGRRLWLAPGDTVCRAGQPAWGFGMVCSGYMIYELTMGGRSKIGGFAFPGALVGDYPGCMYGEVARFDIVAGRESEVCLMDGALLRRMVDTDPEVARQFRWFAESVYRSLLDRYCDLYEKSPSERYLHLLERYPQILQDVPLKHIASYLGISDVHLSRIRRETLH